MEEGGDSPVSMESFAQRKQDEKVHHEITTSYWFISESTSFPILGWNLMAVEPELLLKIKLKNSFGALLCNNKQKAQIFVGTIS